MAVAIEVEDNAKPHLFRLNDLGGREPQVERIKLSIVRSLHSRLSARRSKAMRRQ
jgi:hypothetical protein